MNISKEETVASVFCVFSARCFGFDSLCESKESDFERAIYGGAGVDGRFVREATVTVKRAVTGL